MDRHHVFTLGPEFDGDATAVEKLCVHVELANGYSKNFFPVRFKNFNLDRQEQLTEIELDLWYSQVRTASNMLASVFLRKSPIEGMW